MKTGIHLVILRFALCCYAEEQIPYYKTEAFRKQYEERMRQYEAHREKRIEEIKESFHSEILPALEKLKPELKFGHLTERENDWPPAFRKHGIRFVELRKKGT